MAAGIAMILPMINTYGIAVTNALCAAMVWISFGCVHCVSVLFHAVLILALCQDPLLYHPVWGMDESLLRRWFFNRREQLINHRVTVLD